MSFENIIEEEKRKSIIQNIEKSISNNIDLDIEKGGKRAKIERRNSYLGRYEIR